MDLETRHSGRRGHDEHATVLSLEQKLRPLRGVSARKDAARSLPHVRPPNAVAFPPVPFDGRDARRDAIRKLLWRVLEHTLGTASSVELVEAIYYDPIDTRRYCQPDLFVKLGEPDEAPHPWKTWEHGVPELIVEIPSDDWLLDEHLYRYTALGTSELIVFDASRERIRAWDRIDDDLVERCTRPDSTPCVTLGGHFVTTRGHAETPVALRLADDEMGTELWPTLEEATDAHVRTLERVLHRNGVH
jgi:hypothetical protein